MGILPIGPLDLGQDRTGADPDFTLAAGRAGALVRQDAIFKYGPEFSGL